MTIKQSLVDLTGLPPWPSAFVAATYVHAAVDRWYELRMTMGPNVLAPSLFAVVPLGGVLLIWRIS